MKFRFFLMAMLTLVALPLQGQAGMVLFHDLASFQTATGATSATGLLPSLGGPLTKKKVGSITFTITYPAYEFYIGDYIPLIPGNEITISDRENLNAAMDSPVYAAGFYFVEPTDDTTNVPEGQRYDSTFEITLKNDGSTVGSLTFDPDNDTLIFLGIWCDAPFNRMEFRETVGGIDNEYYGEFYTGTKPLPTPSTLLLFSSGVLALGGLARRKISY